jgi:death-on-curing protein
MDDPIWISVELAMAIHKRQLAEHGGADGVRDMGLLESALNRPRHLFAYAQPTPEVPALAASYAFGVARNHAFIDGNKRSAYVICRTFMILNGYDLTAAKVDRYTIFLDLAAGSITEEELATWLIEHSVRTDTA